MDSIGTEGSDPLLWRDNRKRKRVCGSVVLYLDKRKTMGWGMEKKKNRERTNPNLIQGCRDFSGIGPGTQYTHWGWREVEPVQGLVASSEA